MGGYNLPPGDLICYLAFWEKERWGDVMISIGLRDFLAASLMVWSSRGEYGGCFHLEEFLARFPDLFRSRS